MAYRVKTEKFEGPLDTLLNLIEEKKLSIGEISLARVYEDFLVHVKTFIHLPKEEIASFLVVASVLMLIKSRALIPSLELSEEEKGSIEELENRLQLLREFRHFSKYVQEYAKNRNALFSRDVRLSHLHDPKSGMDV